MEGSEFKKIKIIIEALRRHKEFQQLIEGSLPFLIYRTDTGVVLARNIYGYEQAKVKAGEIRKKYSLKWDQVKFKADRKASGSSSKRYDYSSRYNTSKRTRFKGYYDSQGNYHDID